MLILHVSDTHLGKRQYSLLEREKDLYDVFSKIVDIALENHVDAVIHSGDLFDVHNPPNNAILNAIKSLRKLKEANIPFLSIPGDHDMPKRKGYIYPHNILAELDLIKILDYRTPYILGNNLEVYGISHVPTISRQILKEMLSSLKPSSTRSILLLHQGFKQLLPYESSWQLEIGDLPKGFGYYALGHLHDRWKMEMDNGSIVAIAGSPDIMREEEIAGYEKNRKGVYLIDFSKNLPILQEINLEIRPQIVRAVDTRNLKVDIQNIKDEIKKLKSKPILHIILRGEKMRRDKLNAELTTELSDVVAYYRIYKDETSQTIGNLTITPPKDKGLDKIILEYLTEYEKFSKEEAELIIEMIKNVDSSENVEKILMKLGGLE
ncbi:hydroxyacid dehydrogenase [Sulfolobus sp. A20-N-F8]|nr:hydroxyacid dehydrogenase [Sulfolobus sp. A20-N-F8]